MNTGWNETLQRLMNKGEACALITIFSTKGSTPRKSGCKMVVSLRKSYYSIGGGHLEHKAIKLAREMLQSLNEQAFIKPFPLGATLGQCCGGQIELLFEAFYPPKHNFVVFGAGHIANALIPMLSQLPCSVQWIDQRSDLFPKTVANNVEILIADQPELMIDQLLPNSYIIIMTHNHQLDLKLCEALLVRQSTSSKTTPVYQFLGLIGSSTKWKKFQLRLEQKAFSKEQIASIHCPIGLLSNNTSDIEVTMQKGKSPMEIAISVAAHFINHYQHHPNK